MAIVLELLIPLAFFGLVGWGFWLWYRLKLARAEKVARLEEELTELREYRRDTEARLQALETIATLGEGRARISTPDDIDRERKRKG